jgi:hypothetical protein
MKLLGDHDKIKWTDDQEVAWKTFVKAMTAAEKGEENTPDLCRAFFSSFVSGFTDADVTLSVHVFGCHVPYFFTKFSGIHKHCQQGAEHRISLLQSDYLSRTCRRAGELAQAQAQPSNQKDEDEYEDEDEDEDEYEDEDEDEDEENHDQNVDDQAEQENATGLSNIGNLHEIA